MNGNSSLQELIAPKSLGQDPSEIVTTEKVMADLKAKGVPSSFDVALRDLLDSVSEENRGRAWIVLDNFWGGWHAHREDFFQEQIVRLGEKYRIKR